MQVRNLGRARFCVNMCTRLRQTNVRKSEKADQSVGELNNSCHFSELDAASADSAIDAWESIEELFNSFATYQPVHVFPDDLDLQDFDSNNSNIRRPSVNRVRKYLLTVHMLTIGSGVAIWTQKMFGDYGHGNLEVLYVSVMATIIFCFVNKVCNL